MSPRQEPVDPFEVLGVAPGSTKAEIRRAYRRRAQAIHPDVAGVEATGQMAALNHARDELLAMAPARRRTPRREPPAWAAAHEGAWPDYWSAWNELPRRDEG